MWKFLKAKTAVQTLSSRPGQPPKYTKHDTTVKPYDPSRTDLDALQRECVRVSGEEAAYGSKISVNLRRVERLRTFLRHALIADYEPEEKDSVAEVDETEFLDVAAYITDLRRMDRGSKTCTEFATSCQLLTQEIMTNTVEPARELGISVQIVLAIIVRYAANLDDRGRYRGCVEALEKAGRYRDLCNKLYADAYIVIPAVFKFTSKRFRLMNIAEAELNRCKKAHANQLAAWPDAGGCQYNPWSGMNGPLERIGNPVYGQPYLRARNTFLRWFSLG